MENFQCCPSPKITLSHPYVRCSNCNSNQPLIDFPVSWDWHRHYSIYYSGVDPGPDRPLEYSETIKENPNRPPEYPEAIEERLERIEQMLLSIEKKLEQLRKLPAEKSPDTKAKERKSDKPLKGTPL